MHWNFPSQYEFQQNKQGIIKNKYKEPNQMKKA